MAAQELPLDREDVVTMMEVLFDVRRYTSEIHAVLFEEDEGEEEEEPDHS